MFRIQLAYIDPGSGSYIFQIVIASALAVGVGVRLFWSRIRGLARAIFSRRQR